MTDRILPQLLQESPQLDLTGVRKIDIPLNFESCTTATPDVFKLGGFKGFSLPIYDASGSSATEQVFTRFFVPDQYKNNTPAKMTLLIGLGDAETKDDKFRMKFLWAKGSGATIATATLASAISENATIASGSESKYTLYDIDIDIPASEISHGASFEGIIRLLGSSTTATISNEILLFNGKVEFLIDKIFGER